MNRPCLPERPRSHTLEQESRDWVRGCFPREWTVEDVQPDYGTDLRVEVFEERRPTGMLLDVQVKGTDAPIPSDECFSYSAKVKWINYCLTRPCPVCLVHYFAPSKKALWLWVKDYAHLVLDVANPNWQSQVTATLQLPTRKEFGPGSMGEVLAYLYSGGWLSLIDDYRRLLEVADPLREADLLGLTIPSIDEEELRRLCAVFPAQVHDRIGRIHGILQHARDQRPITRDDGEFATKHLRPLVMWAAQERAKLSSCRSNLKQIALACMMYEQDNGTFPTCSNWRAEIARYVGSDSILTCPSSPEAGYAINPIVAGLPRERAGQAVLLFDCDENQKTGALRPTARHLAGANVAMTDSNTRWVTLSQLQGFPEFRAPLAAS
ncbi:MAG: hypothetical protein COZ06_18190 [Armatimonadetes bacterium CG_4_10_14_3_um_filter_66_18]|nr:DUF4365 domain-containing protein [Armatimonadota bacterium]OIO96593.1 MAG: hypothetical protein AUJ96_24540 [Armatimonadetes bacterium CG2_30_66_41]PIU67337.1 MAG: hypothetical protein COS85_01110 [Armatimonadetes bacterium CG07_land_8_20_14_0_80_59_28]PIU94510.1 MAG: hypothetical protein COS65_07265 [Armatimonadetes bacterium CG06_land_8_20_14_3_00_66_21]PIX43426.1 MAG: hypothetical protein COZ57_19240 [Armatimonadetes bacterium CG_4_8_14_3_um_filter_66_20]PIY46940.1 MAG: hypothetical pro